MVRTATARRRARVAVLATVAIATSLLAGAVPASAAGTVSLPHGVWTVETSPDGESLYVLGRDTELTKIDAVTAEVEASASVGLSANAIALGSTPVGERAYVSYVGRFGDAHGMTVVDLDTWTVVADIAMTGYPMGLAMAPDGETLYMVKYTGGGIDVIDTTTNAVTAFLPVAELVTGVAVSPDGSTLYVIHLVFGSDEALPSLSVVDVATGAITGQVVIPSGGGGSGFSTNPTDVAVSPDGDRVYVTEAEGQMTYAIDTATLGVVAAVPVGTLPTSVVIDPSGERVFVANYAGGTLTEIDTATWATRTYPVLPRPRSAAVSPDGLTIYVPDEVAPFMKVFRRPDVATITPAVGSPAGGTSVTITGTNLGGATSVSFGDVEAASFSVDSPTQITAISPPGSGGPVPVRVTTPDGISSPVTFTYQPAKIATTMVAEPVLRTLPNLVAHLTTTSGEPVVGRTVTFTGRLLGLPVVLCTVSTDAAGTATCAGGGVIGLLGGGYTASFPGDATYEPSNAVGTLA